MWWVRWVRAGQRPWYQRPTGALTWNDRPNTPAQVPYDVDPAECRTHIVTRAGARRPRTASRGRRELPRLDARCVRLLSPHVHADGGCPGVRAARQVDRAVAHPDPDVPTRRGARLRRDGRAVGTQEAVDDQPAVLLDHRGIDGTGAELRDVLGAARALRHRHGR